ncbi:MAG TPA: pitrilysin family protein [Thermoanaerobaculia bacterium]|nr:pitrilysin family protein [Thermoanaerobaculia bacterium]
MRRLAAPGLLLALLSLTAAAQRLEIQERTLSNGMRLLLVPRHEDPTVACGWVAHVGSANERPGITGISHLFEHMMFKGTRTIGTTDAAADLAVLEEQEKVRGEMREEESKMRASLRRGEIEDLTRPESATPRWRDLQKRFEELVVKERNVLAKAEFERIYTKEGASGLNAFTNQDMTVYFVTVPKNKLELWFWMESDRLLAPVFREFYAERDVVFEERRMRVESTPTGYLDEAFDEMFWHGHPYTWEVTGYPSDIPQISKADADRYYGLFYAPNNVTAALVGDFDPERAAALAERYLGRIPRGKQSPPEMTTLPPKWQGEMRFSGQAETNPQVEMRWHTVPFGHRDSYALEVLESLLNGRTGRLYKALVDRPDGIATETEASQSSQKYAGAFSIAAEAAEAHTPEEVERAIEAELARLRTELAPERELTKVKNQFAASAYRRLSGSTAILIQLLSYDGLGDFQEMNAWPARIGAVTAEDVRRVARTYLTKESRAVAIYTRKAAR